MSAINSKRCLFPAEPGYFLLKRKRTSDKRYFLEKMRIFLAKEKADKDICSQRGEGGQGIFLAKEKTDVGQGKFQVEKDKADKGHF